MDVVALSQNGIDYAVASLGTATTTEQIQKMFRTTHEIIFCYDGDNAGKKAAWRALERMLPLLKPEYRPRFLYLPDSHDPDSLLQEEGKTRFETRLENDAKPCLETWLLGLKNIAGAGADGMARMAKKADQMLSTMSDHYLQQAWKLEVEKQTGINLQQNTIKPRIRPAPMRASFRTPSHLLAEYFLAALLQKPARLAQLPAEAKQFILDNALYQQLYTRVFSLQDSKDTHTISWAAQLQREFPEAAKNISRWMNQEAVADMEFTSLVLDMRRALLQRSMTTSRDLAEIARLKKIETTLNHEQKELNAEIDEQRRGNE